MSKVYLVGAGPGDPKLITLRGIELLKTCDMVIYDRLASYELLNYLKDGCKKVFVGKEAGNHYKTQEEINKIIVESAYKYEKVVRLKGGDPFVFGRGGEEIEELNKHGIPFEVIPGVTSAISVPASVGIPVTHRGVSRSFHVITGHTKSSENTLTDNYEVLGKLDGTLVFLMGLSNLKNITDKLMENGKDKKTPAAVISNGTMNNEKTVRGTLSDIAVKVKEEGIKSPAIIVVGDTAAFNFTSIDTKPLSNVKIGITGTGVMYNKLESGLHRLGARVYSICNMKIEETPFIYQLEEELQRIDKYQWIIFTSQNAINIFFDKMEKYQVDRRKLNQIKFAVIGSGTKQTLQKYGYFADFMPNIYTTKNLADEFSKVVFKNEKVLIPRALRGSQELTMTFEDNNIEYKEIPIYDVKGELTENKEYISEMDCLVFLSASGVNAFFEEIHKNNIQLPNGIKIACIGEVTVNEVKENNYNADIIASISNIDGLIDKIKNYIWEK
ncbi:uroporphyrinogen-III C-methyltransferase [Clostridium homopropionicum DSM 5847]|uniref:uroporphyrinogen-III C-methyltransferase n=1 Tax=Clostridium homopropionicum DSM 5847 TaxID=1121318 RepID=A0A0L6ZCK4_9CLOT|nr:uroporphyrinogen-III C-methyltransferase [Clostridium homopropionicum]KOA20695.1 uroporphyrinogen-III C-methyltransferase [Clostridium homopropionicum DSM 5847]SFF91281.1 uroporphyrinogen III methyltransferase / synthase [Clostridium homopropionicum]